LRSFIKNYTNEYTSDDDDDAGDDDDEDEEDGDEELGTSARELCICVPPLLIVHDRTSH
jgi:hypothetical protein